MKTQNTTSNTAVAFGTTITSVGTMSVDQSLPTSAANEKAVDMSAHYLEIAEEASYWMIVVAAFAFQLLLVNLINAI
jgi:hypothetical protein